MNPFLTLWLAGIAALLASCGGGNPPYVPTTPVSCSLPLQYANGSSSGIAISPHALSADRQFASCNPMQIRTLTLTVCTDHPAIGELSAQLRLSGTTLAQFQLQDGTVQGSSCLANISATTSLRQFTFNTPDMHALSQFTGPWSLDITDTVQNNNNGAFVAWSLDLQGVR